MSGVLSRRPLGVIGLGARWLFWLVTLVGAGIGLKSFSIVATGACRERNNIFLWFENILIPDMRKISLFIIEKNRKMTPSFTKLIVCSMRSENGEWLLVTQLNEISEQNWWTMNFNGKMCCNKVNLLESSDSIMWKWFRNWPETNIIKQMKSLRYSKVNTGIYIVRVITVVIAIK